MTFRELTQRAAHRIRGVSGVFGRKGRSWFAVCFASSLGLAVVEYGLVAFLQLFLTSLGYFDRSQMPAVLRPLSGIGTAGLCGLLVLIGSLRSVALFLSAHCNDITQEVVAYRLKQVTLYELLLRKGRHFLPASEVHFRMGELYPKTQHMIFNITNLLVSSIQVVSLTAGMFYLAWRESLIGMAGLVFAGLIVLRSNRVVGENARIVPTIQNQVAKGVERVSRNWLFVRISGTQELEHGRLIERTTTNLQASLRVSFFNNLMMGIPPLFGICLFAVIIYVSRTEFLTPASILVSRLYLFLRLVQHLGSAALFFGQITKYWPQFSRAMDAFFTMRNDEIVDALKFEPSIRRSRMEPLPQPVGAAAVQVDAPTSPPALAIRNVSFAWEAGRPPVLDRLSWDVPAGAIAGVVGPSGSGKSTLLLLSLGLLEPSEGQITIAGTAPAQYFEQNRARLGYVGAEPFLMAGTLEENLEYGLDQKPAPADLWAAIEQAQLGDTIRSFADGLGHRLDENGSGLSTGQKQRLALARALLRRPQVLVLDEATANLDNATELEIASVIKQLKGKCTVLIVSHRQGILEAADQVLRLEAQPN